MRFAYSYLGTLHLSLWLMVATCVGVLGACHNSSPNNKENPHRERSESSSRASVVTPSASMGTHSPTPQPVRVQANEMTTVPGGKFHFGSEPGEPGRDPSLEPPTHLVNFGPFEIDRLPFPNQPGVPAKTDITREEAQRLCEQVGKRLCTEAEWERACKGKSEAPYPTGTKWDKSCAEPGRLCVNELGIVSMGTHAAEWTASDVTTEGSVQSVIRGASSDTRGTDHRCAHRAVVSTTTHRPTIGFRCCRGEPQSVEVPPPKVLPTYQQVEIDIKQLQAVFDREPRLAGLGTIRLFSSPKSEKLVLSKGKGERGGNQLTTSPVLWSPVPGEQILVIAGVGSTGSSFVAAFYSLGDGHYKLASSLLFRGQTDPIVLAYNGWTKRRVRWSTCWECVGEEGFALYRRGGRVVIEQR